MFRLPGNRLIHHVRTAPTGSAAAPAGGGGPDGILTSAAVTARPKRRVCIAIILMLLGSVTLGCQCGTQQTCSPRKGRKNAVTAVDYPPVLFDAPVVAVIAGPTAPELQAEADFFVRELRAALSSLGGIRILPPAPPPPSPLSPCADGCYVVDATLPVPHAAATGAGAVPLQPAHSDATLEVAVSVLDFHPYRPMQLDTLITITDLSTGDVLTTLDGVWHANPEDEPIADASCSLRKELKRPRHRAAIEWNALTQHSPAWFLKQTARKTAPSVRDACLSSAGFIEPL